MATVRKKAEQVEQAEVEAVAPVEEVKTKSVEPTPVASSYVHIDLFLETARQLYEMNTLEVQGFRAYMTGKHYQKKITDYVPHLEKYLGKEVK